VRELHQVAAEVSAALVGIGGLLRPRNSSPEENLRCLNVARVAGDLATIDLRYVVALSDCDVLKVISHLAD
jgi:hypothetical protein